MATRIKWNMRAFQQIRRMPEVDSTLQKIVDDIADEANAQIETDGYRAEVSAGKTRSRGAVYTYDFEAILNNAEDNTLVRLLAKARGNVT